MYDNVNLILSKEKAGQTDLLAEIPVYLSNVSEHRFNNSESISITGYSDSLKVIVNENNVKIKDSSLCKWYLGDNLQTLSKRDTQRAIQKISDVLHLPFSIADVTRIDIAQNFIMKNDVSIYYNHLGLLQYFTRLEQNKGLYYQTKNKHLVFYDKIAESKAKGLLIPEMFKNRYVLRYEQRYLHRLREQFNISEIKASLLYDEQFYSNLIKSWHTDYKNINKLRDNLKFDYSMIKTKKQFSLQAILYYVTQKGGELEALREITEAQRQGLLTKKQAFDLRDEIKKACKNELLTSTSDVIVELDTKVKQAVKFYN